MRRRDRPPTIQTIVEGGWFEISSRFQIEVTKAQITAVNALISQLQTATRSCIAMVEYAE